MSAQVNAFTTLPATAHQFLVDLLTTRWKRGRLVETEAKLATVLAMDDPVERNAALRELALTTSLLGPMDASALGDEYRALVKRCEAAIQ